jgi:hypothetical protein
MVPLPASVTPSALKKTIHCFRLSDSGQLAHPSGGINTPSICIHRPVHGY